MPSLNFAPRVPVFDAQIRVGDEFKEPSPFRDRAELLTEMDAFGVQRALAYHAQAEVLSPVEGNLRLQDWIAEDGRLIPQWSVAPTTDSIAQVRALSGQGKVRCVRLFNTRAGGLPFRPWAYDALLSWLSDEGIPVWVPLPDADADEVASTLQSYPRLVTVLVGAHYTHHLWVRPLLRTLPNAYLELSRYEPIGQIEALLNEFGAKRLVYGSWYPRYAMGTMLFYLHHTDMSDSELALVCAGNLEQILRGGTT